LWHNIKPMRALPSSLKYGLKIGLTFLLLVSVGTGVAAGLFLNFGDWVNIHESFLSHIVAAVSIVLGLVATFSSLVMKIREQKSSEDVTVRIESPEGYRIESVDPKNEKSLRDFLNRVFEKPSNERHPDQ
jgi:hypothetical protein